jgi:hypothetical protein
LTETTGDIVHGHDYHVASNVGGEQSAQRKKTDYIDCAGGSAQDGR